MSKKTYRRLAAQDASLSEAFSKTTHLNGLGVHVDGPNEAHVYVSKSLTWTPLALERIETIRDLHSPIACDSCSGSMCAECRQHNVWPCKTRQILDLGGVQ